MLKVICDFCGEEITTKQNKGGKVKKFRLEENVCDKCKEKDLNAEYDKNKTKLKEEWSMLEKERRRFFDAVLKKQKREWGVEKKKEFLGSFYKEK